MIFKELRLVTGAKRSGTHMLNRLLDGHPELGNTIGESYIFEYCHHGGINFEKQVIDWVRHAPVRGVFEGIKNKQLLPTFSKFNLYDGSLDGIWLTFKMNFDRKKFLSSFEKKRGSINSFQDLIYVWLSALKEFDPWNQMNKQKYWVFKCADFGKTLLGVMKLRLPFKTVFLVRNPLDVINSIKKLRSMQPHRQFHVFELLTICHDLNESVKIIDRIKDKSLVLRYEQLIQEPEPLLRSLCHFWNISWNDCLLKATLLGKPWKPNSSFQTKRGIARKDILTATEKEIIRNNTQLYQKSFAYKI